MPGDGQHLRLKPAEWTPFTAFLLAELMQEAGVPEGVFNVVRIWSGRSRRSTDATSSCAIDIFYRRDFHRESDHGCRIRYAEKVSFELGGKGSNIIFDDADLKEALPTAIRAAFRNRGRSCLAG